MDAEFNKELIGNMPFMNRELELEERVKDLLGRLSLDEKFKLCSGRRMWYTSPIKRLGIKSFTMYDGPHGVRPDFGETKCTYFPSAICRAATWNPELSKKFGIAVAQEVRDVGGHMLLAPGINIQRTPLCGRTFEYQTEDPFLNKKLAVAVVKGIQSQKIAACVKHYICNNQETNRFTVSSEISERTLQEIYYPAFKATVQEADAWSFMSCYNKINGIYGSEHHYLIREKLMNEWGFRGFVVSDWGAATRTTSTENCIKAGLTLEMPTADKYKKKKLMEAYNAGKFTEGVLNDNISRLLRIMFLVGLFDDGSTIPPGSRNTSEHQTVAREIAEEGIILLKNENSLLPLNLDKVKKIAVIGPNADVKVLGADMESGGGSSLNFPPYEIIPLEGIREKCRDKIDIIDNPAIADITIIFAGLNHKHGMDAEGVDKQNFDLPLEQINFINNTAGKNPNTVVVLINGSPIGMDDWLVNVPAVVEAWYSGMESGHAIANVLFGDINPSGKLPITFPKKLSDSPAHQSKRTFPGDEKVLYEEGIFVGYRHFDTRNIEPLFPFGYGLSYTTFEYENLEINKEKVTKDENFSISFTVYNSGNRIGKEVVQLYVQDIESSVERPTKELKGFQKVELKPGERKSLKFILNKDVLSFFDGKKNSWIVEDGYFNILLGSSSRDIRLQGKIEYNN